jgi:signal peptidase I
MDADDLRARLDAQIAARRASGAPRRRRPKEPDPRYERALRFLRPLRRVLLVLAVAGLLTFVLRRYIVEPFYVPSGSMEPTLHGCDGCRDDYLLVDKLSYRLHAVHDGDVVVFTKPPLLSAPDHVLVKRVIAVGGEKLQIANGKVYVDGKQLTESYLNPVCGGVTELESQPATVTVPAGDVWVMGDNRCDSQDSRTFGPIKASTIIGRAFVVVWPLSRLHWL